MFLESVIFFLSTFFTFILTIRDFPVEFLQQILVVILLILIFLSKKIFSQGHSTLTQVVKLTGLFLSALLIQLFVFSTGGFYSPFLPLIHIYTLGISFLISYQVGIVFIIFSVLSLILASYINPVSLKLFQDDPTTGVIYFISFIVVVPLAQFLVKNYQIKDRLSKTLARYLNIYQTKEQNVIQNVNEIVIATNRDLQIISINNAFEKTFKLHTIDVEKKDLLQIISLTDSSGELIVKEALSLDKLFLNKTTIILKDCYLKLPSKLEKVVIQISPILDKDQEVEQIIFLITEAKLSNEVQRHSSIEEALKRHKQVGEILKKSLMEISHPELATYAELFAKQEEDLITVIEIEDHPIKEVISLLDVALECMSITSEMKDFANTLNVPLDFNLPKGEESEYTIFEIAKGEDATSTQWSFSHFAVPIDEKWLRIIIQKLIEVSILISSSYEKPGVWVSLIRDENEVNIKISANFSKIDDQKLDQLFLKYFGTLKEMGNLKLGSGLEGFIARVLADELNIILGVESKDNPPKLLFNLKLAKNPHLFNLQIQT